MIATLFDPANRGNLSFDDTTNWPLLPVIVPDTLRPLPQAIVAR